MQPQRSAYGGCKRLDFRDSLSCVCNGDFEVSIAIVRNGEVKVHSALSIIFLRQRRSERGNRLRTGVTNLDRAETKCGVGYAVKRREGFGMQRAVRLRRIRGCSCRRVF